MVVFWMAGLSRRNILFSKFYLMNVLLFKCVHGGSDVCDTYEGIT